MPNKMLNLVRVKQHKMLFNILDLTSIDAWKETSGQNMSRPQFPQQLTEKLTEDYHEFLSPR